MIKFKCVHLSVKPREGAPRLGRESQLRVGRDTELYRILNMHYNKSNVYQVRKVCQFAAFTDCAIVYSPWVDALIPCNAVSVVKA